MSNALAAAAVGSAVGMTPEQLADGLNAATRVSAARMELTERPDGVTIINDAFNANPDSTRAALKALVAIGRSRGARTWAVLGEMLELGDASADEHDAIGRLVVRLDVNRLLVVGAGRNPFISVPRWKAPGATSRPTSTASRKRSSCCDPSCTRVTSYW